MSSGAQQLSVEQEQAMTGKWGVLNIHLNVGAEMKLENYKTEPRLRCFKKLKKEIVGTFYPSIATN